MIAVMPQCCVSPRMQGGPAHPAYPEPSVLRFLPAQSQVTGFTPLGTTHVIQCWPQPAVAPPPHPVYLILLYRPDGVWLPCAPFPSLKTAAGQLLHKCPARVNGCPALSCSWHAHHLALQICCRTAVLQLPCGAFCRCGCAHKQLPQMCPAIILPAGQSCNGGPRSDKDTQESCRTVGVTHYAIRRKADRE